MNLPIPLPTPSLSKRKGDGDRTMVDCPACNGHGCDESGEGPCDECGGYRQVRASRLKWTCDAEGNWEQRVAPAPELEWLSRNRENARSEK